ncbi:hypothetical protein [Bacillus thuringiensis]|nr:hypothetical protein [Bacillus thuringiensis]
MEVKIKSEYILNKMKGRLRFGGSKAKALFPKAVEFLVGKYTLIVMLFIIKILFSKKKLNKASDYAKALAKKYSVYWGYVDKL